MLQGKSTTIILLLAILTFTVILPEKLIGRNLYYFFSAMIFVCSIVKIKHINFQLEEVMLSMSIFLVGLSQCIWAYRFPGDSTELYRADFNYPKTGAYLMIGSIIILCFPSLIRLASVNYKKHIAYALLTSFTCLTVYAIYCKLSMPMERLEIKTSSTLSAAIYTMHSLLTLYSLLNAKIKYRRLMILFVVLFSVYILILTETRSALIVYPLILVYFIFSKSTLPKRKSFAIFLASIFLSLMVIKLLHPNLNKRGVEMIDEVTHYHENNNTSVGARLSMWNAGIHEIITHPGGVSSKERFRILSSFINKNERGNPEAIRNIAYHLHNDLIESMSLQGVISGVFMLYFYFSLFFYFHKKNTSYCAAVFLCTPIMFMGSLDSLFIHVRFVVMLICWLIIFNGINELDLQNKKQC